MHPDELKKNIPKKEAQELLKQRKEEIAPDARQDTQSERGRLFEILADITDEDGALAEMEDLESLGDWLSEVDQEIPPETPPPTGENLLDQASREKLPELYNGEEKGLEAIAPVKFFTPDSNWT